MICGRISTDGFPAFRLSNGNVHTKSREAMLIQRLQALICADGKDFFSCGIDFAA